MKKKTRIHYTYNNATEWYESSEIFCQHGFVLSCFKQDKETRKTSWQIVLVGGHIPIYYGECPAKEKAISALRKQLISCGANFQDEIRIRKESNVTRK